MKSIINLNKSLEVYIESGTARLRFKEDGAFKALLEEKLAEIKILISKETSSLNPSISNSPKNKTRQSSMPFVQPLVVMVKLLSLS